MYKGGSENVKDLSKADQKKFFEKYLKKLVTYIVKENYPNDITDRQLNKLMYDYGYHIQYGIDAGDYILLKPSQYLGKKWKKGKKGGAIDIHKAIGKLPKPKSGWTPGKYKYMGPYNLLENQLEYDKNTGEVSKWHVQPHNKVDEIAAYHDICYDMGENKGDCDRQMVASLDKMVKCQNGVRQHDS